MMKRLMKIEEDNDLIIKTLQDKDSRHGLAESIVNITIDVQGLKNNMVRSIEEMKQGMKEELRQEIRGEIKQGIKQELKQEIKQEIKQELKQEIKQELKLEVKQEIAEVSQRHDNDYENMSVVLDEVKSNMKEQILHINEIHNKDNATLFHKIQSILQDVENENIVRSLNDSLHGIQTSTIDVPTKTSQTSRKTDDVTAKDIHSSNEFVFMFLETSPYAKRYPAKELLSLLFTTERPATVVVECPALRINTGYRIDTGMFNIDLGKLALPSKLTVENKGIYVRASQNISLHVFNHGYYQTEAFSALPTAVLSTKYIIVSYTPTRGSVAGIVALEDNTDVTVKLNTEGSISFNGNTYRNGDSFTIGMSRLNSFLLSHTSDLTGTTLTSNKPISVTIGNICALHNDPSICQHLSEQILPVELWGKNFLVPSVPDSNKGYILRLIPSVYNTGITVHGKSGSKLYTMHGYEFIDLDISSNNLNSIYASNPIFVSMIAKFSSGSRTSADPFMVTIPSINEYGSRYRVAISESREFVKHKIIILIEERMARGILIDNASHNNTAISTYTVHINLTNYLQLTAEVAPGMHILSHSNPNVKFGVLVFGYGYYTGYGYLGQKLE